MLVQPMPLSRKRPTRRRQIELTAHVAASKGGRGLMHNQVTTAAQMCLVTNPPHNSWVEVQAEPLFGANTRTVRSWIL